LPAARDVLRSRSSGSSGSGSTTSRSTRPRSAVDAGTASMLVNVGPIILAVLAGLVLREGFPRRLFAGCAIALAGVVVIATATSTRASPRAGARCSASRRRSSTRSASSRRSRCWRACRR
jgi:hypothetical protein